MTNKRYAYLGTISHGTLRNEELLTAFTDALQYAMLNYHWQGQTDQAQAFSGYRQLINEAMTVDAESEDADWLINESLFDALNDFAAPYSYFGANEGDASDFGYWPMCDAESLEDARESGYRVEISDHGNVALYDANDEEIWSIV